MLCGILNSAGFLSRDFLLSQEASTDLTAVKAMLIFSLNVNSAEEAPPCS